MAQLNTEPNMAQLYTEPNMAQLIGSTISSSHPPPPTPPNTCSYEDHLHDEESAYQMNSVIIFHT